MSRLLSALALLLMLSCAFPGQAQEAARERLILKDGSYQTVRSYTVTGGRVRFRSAERNDWEEMPADLVDWKATEDWNHEHAPDKPPAADDPAAQEAAALDREAAARRDAERARQPIVAPGLRLPDESGVWGLDTYNGSPELVRIRQSDGDLNLDTGHSVKAIAIPDSGAKQLIRLEGYRAKVTFHVPRPLFYVALNPLSDQLAPDDALVVDTHGMGKAMADTTQQASADSRYALVRLSSGKDERVATAQELSGLATGGVVDGSSPVIVLHKRILPGGRWMQLEPESDLNLGQYSLIEILPGDGMNLDGWDFGVNPMAPDNPGGFGPVQTDEPAAPR